MGILRRTIAPIASALAGAATLVAGLPIFSVAALQATGSATGLTSSLLSGYLNVMSTLGTTGLGGSVASGIFAMTSLFAEAGASVASFAVGTLGLSVGAAATAVPLLASAAIIGLAAYVLPKLIKGVANLVEGTAHRGAVQIQRATSPHVSHQRAPSQSRAPQQHVHVSRPAPAPRQPVDVSALENEQHYADTKRAAYEKTAAAYQRALEAKQEAAIAKAKTDMPMPLPQAEQTAPHYPDHPANHAKTSHADAYRKRQQQPSTDITGYMPFV